MKPLRVLVVDDCEIFTEMVTFILSAAAYEVAVAFSAEQAAPLIPAFRPDLILLDLQMPGMSGFEYVRQLKSDPATAGIVVVAFSASQVKSDERQLRSLGFNGFIGKPVEVSTLAAKIRFWAEGPEKFYRSRFTWPSPSTDSASGPRPGR